MCNTVLPTCGPEVWAIGAWLCTGGDVPNVGGWNADLLLLLDSPVLRRKGLGGLKIDCMPEAEIIKSTIQSDYTNGCLKTIFFNLNYNQYWISAHWITMLIKPRQSHCFPFCPKQRNGFGLILKWIIRFSNSALFFDIPILLDGDINTPIPGDNGLEEFGDT